jgi:hypothetical protein
LKVFLSSPLERARFFPHLSSRSSPHHRLFKKKLENLKIFGGVSNLNLVLLFYGGIQPSNKSNSAENPEQYKGRRQEQLGADLAAAIRAVGPLVGPPPPLP